MAYIIPTLIIIYRLFFEKLYFLGNAIYINKERFLVVEIGILTTTFVNIQTKEVHSTLNQNIMYNLKSKSSPDYQYRKHEKKPSQEKKEFCFKSYFAEEDNE